MVHEMVMSKKSKEGFRGERKSSEILTHVGNQFLGALVVKNVLRQRLEVIRVNSRGLLNRKLTKLSYPPTSIAIIKLSPTKGVIIHVKLGPGFVQVKGEIPLETGAGGVVSLLDGEIREYPL